MHVYKVRLRSDKRSADLIFDAPWYIEPDAISKAIGYAQEELRGPGTTFIIWLSCVISCLDSMGKLRKRGRPRIRTAEYWREYYIPHRMQRKFSCRNGGFRPRRPL